MGKDRGNMQIKRQRLDRIMVLLGEGKMRYQIMDILTGEWGMSQRGIQKYLDKANFLLKNSFTDEDLVAQYKYIHHKTLNESPAIALKALDSISKLKKNGYNNDTNIVFNVTIGDDK